MKRILFVILLALSWVYPAANTEIMTEIGPALGYNASVKQILHIGNDDGLSTTRTAIYDADGTASYLLLATTSIAVNDGTDNWLLMTGLATTLAIGASATDDFVLEDTAGVDIITIQGDVKDILFTLDGSAASDFLINDGGGVILTVASDENSVTWALDGSADADFSIGDGSTEFFLLETDNGDITIANGTYDFDIASHDGTNGLKLGGTLVTSSAAEINGLSGLLSSSAELNYLNITVLGTGAASQAVVLDAGEDYTWPTAGVLTYGGTGITANGAEVNYLDITTLGTGAASKAVVLDAGDDYTWPTAGFLTYGGTQITATGAEVNYLDITTLGTGAASKAVVLDAGDDYTWPTAGFITYKGTQVTATGAEMNYLDIATLGTGLASKAVVPDAGDDYTWPSTGIFTYSVLNDGTTTLTATAAQLNAAGLALTEVVTTTNVIAASESGTHFILNSATAFATDLPAPAVGLHFWFHIGATEPTTSHTIVTATSANIIEGQVTTADDAAGDVGCAPDSDTITFAANVAIHGDYVYVWCDGTYWYVSGSCDIFNGITTTQESG